ncbi:unnamed protein product [Phyllotreta striolata]|uniref:F-box domain-containing protein n=1 Tax=Phyllotreta striolata TaxID=444603 RepID=A0A9N9XNB0_PHYSR|nr:unnamed protein product [Phyllotreta striolata]
MEASKSQIDRDYSSLLQLYARANAPNRDYYGLSIGENYIRFDVWKVTRGPHFHPTQKIINIDDFAGSKHLQSEIRNSFGENIHDFIVRLSNGERCLENLPQRAFLSIVKYLSINDVLNLSRVNKIYHEICNSEALWEEMFFKAMGRRPSREESRQASDIGWRNTLKKRIVFVRRATAPKPTRARPGQTMVVYKPSATPGPSQRKPEAHAVKSGTPSKSSVARARTTHSGVKLGTTKDLKPAQPELSGIKPASMYIKPIPPYKRLSIAHDVPVVPKFQYSLNKRILKK